MSPQISSTLSPTDFICGGIQLCLVRFQMAQVRYNGVAVSLFLFCLFPDPSHPTHIIYVTAPSIVYTFRTVMSDILCELHTVSLLPQRRSFVHGRSEGFASREQLSGLRFHHPHRHPIARLCSHKPRLISPLSVRRRPQSRPHSVLGIPRN